MPASGRIVAGELAEAALHPVADDGIADLLRDGEAEAHRGIAVAARADEQDEAGRRRAQAAVRREEVRAAAQLADCVRG